MQKMEVHDIVRKIFGPNSIEHSDKPVPGASGAKSKVNNFANASR